MRHGMIALRFFEMRSAVKPCWANTLLMLVIIGLGTLSMVSACGQKGPLYHPEEKTEKKTQS